MRDWSDQPEASGPQSESDFGQAQVPAVTYPASPRPTQDPAADAIRRTIAAERQADMFRSAPPDATAIS